nr:hypothetical protein GCM10020092_100040 [Actinoplanes digitatis]
MSVAGRENGAAAAAAGADAGDIAVADRQVRRQVPVDGVEAGLDREVGAFVVGGDLEQAVGHAVHLGPGGDGLVDAGVDGDLPVTREAVGDAGQGAPGRLGYGADVAEVATDRAVGDGILVTFDAVRDQLAGLDLQGGGVGHECPGGVKALTPTGEPK